VASAWRLAPLRIAMLCPLDQAAGINSKRSESQPPKMAPITPMTRSPIGQCRLLSPLSQTIVTEMNGARKAVEGSTSAIRDAESCCVMPTEVGHALLALPVGQAARVDLRRDGMAS
jgi:hypothetical protein